jgi:hypothetical protein
MKIANTCYFFQVALGNEIQNENQKALVAQAFQPVPTQAFACGYRKMVGSAHPTFSEQSLMSLRLSRNNEKTVGRASRPPMVRRTHPTRGWPLNPEP